jgi:type II secretory pathway component PulF
MGAKSVTETTERVRCLIAVAAPLIAAVVGSVVVLLMAAIAIFVAAPS